MLDEVRRWIRRQGMFSPGERVAAAVSGGSDSIALLHVLVELAPELGIQVAVAHLNHRLRGAESDADEEFVASIASSLRLRFLRESLDVKGLAEKSGENIEQAARECRYRWFAQLIRTADVSKVAVGHTLSDQAETVLLRLFRGSGSAGLAGVLPVRADGIVRPLLGITREQARSFLEARGVGWREDSSNTDQSRDRNRMRHDLMPLLRSEWNPKLPILLSHLAEWARDEETYWERIISETAPRLMEKKDNAVELSADALAEFPVAMVRRLCRRAIEMARGTLQGIGWDHVEELRALGAEGGKGGRLHLPGIIAVRSFEIIRLEPKPVAGRDRAFDIPVEPPATVSLPGRGTKLVFEIADRGDQNRGYNDSRAETLDWGRVGSPLRLRSWRPGDSYRPVGRLRAKKLKALFQESRTPIWERDGWPVLAVSASAVEHAGRAERIVWARRFGVAEDCKPGVESRKWLRITEIDHDNSNVF